MKTKHKALMILSLVATMGAKDCDNDTVQLCGLACPPRYTPTGFGNDPSCGGGWGNNSVICQRPPKEHKASVEYLTQVSCDEVCPPGYGATGRVHTPECPEASPTNGTLCLRE